MAILRKFLIVSMLFWQSLFGIQAAKNAVASCALSTMDAGFSMAGSGFGVYGRETTSKIMRAMGSVCDSAGDVISKNLSPGYKLAMTAANCFRTASYFLPKNFPDKKNEAPKGRNVGFVALECGLRIGSLFASWYAGNYAYAQNAAGDDERRGKYKKTWARSMTLKFLLRAAADAVSGGTSISTVASAISAIVGSAAVLSSLDGKGSVNLDGKGSVNLDGKGSVNYECQAGCLGFVKNPFVKISCGCFYSKGRKFCSDCFCNWVKACWQKKIITPDSGVSVPDDMYQAALYPSNKMGFTWVRIDGEDYFKDKGSYWLYKHGNWVTAKIANCPVCRVAIDIEECLEALEKYSNESHPDIVELD